MNFEERKAEIFRRANGRIAAKKRKKRIILGSIVPVLLIALLAIPVGSMLGSAKGEEKAPAIQMENQSSIAPGEHPAPQATWPELDLESGLQSSEPLTLGDDPLNTSLDILYHLPPDIYFYSQEGDKIQPMQVSYFWIQVVDGQEIGTVSESLDILQPGVVDEQIDTSHGYLILDASNLKPTSVDAEYWSITAIGTESAFYSKGNNASLYFDEGNDQLFPSSSFTLSSNLYRLELAPGENIYQIQVQWPKGTAWFSFLANYEE